MAAVVAVARQPLMDIGTDLMVVTAQPTPAVAAEVIGAAGENGNYTGGSGGGTMSVPSKSQSPASYYQPAPGGNGLLGFGGAPSSTGYGYISYGGGSQNKSVQAEGDLIITPNEIGVYGGGGSGHCYWYNSSERQVSPAGCGAPGGGGGGGLGKYTTTGSYCCAGDGGFLGGGGGGSSYNDSGHGGNAGGSGGIGYYQQTQRQANQ